MHLGLGLLSGGIGLSKYGPLLLYVGAIVSFLLSIFWKPQIGFYYLVPLLPMQTVRYWLHVYPLGEKVVDIMLLGILIGLFFHAERPIFLSSPLNKRLVFYMVLTYLALWQGALYLGGDLPISVMDPRFSDWKNFAEMMCLFFVAAAVIRTTKQMGIVVVLMCLSVLVVNRSYHGTMQDRDFSHYSDSIRDAGALGYAGENGMGAFQAEFAVFLIGLSACIKKPTVKLALWGIAFTSLYCLLLTFSRAGYLGLMAGLLVLGVVKARKWLVLLVLILVTWQSFVPVAVTQRVLMTYQPGQELDSSSEERITIWQDALQVFHEDPVFGTGFDTYQFMGRVGPYRDTHNYYVKVLLETGVVGLAVFLSLLAAAGKISWRVFRQSRDPLLSGLGCAFFAMLMCAVVVNFFGDRWTYLQVNGFLWVLLGFMARGLFLIGQEEEKYEEEPAEVSVPLPAATEVSHA
jgi:putative inorganic carbon (HCO3(-)) transporter